KIIVSHRFIHRRPIEKGACERTNRIRNAAAFTVVRFGFSRHYPAPGAGRPRIARHRCGGGRGDCRPQPPEMTDRARRVPPTVYNHGGPMNLRSAFAMILVGLVSG